MLQVNKLHNSGTIEVDNLPSGIIIYKITGKSFYDTGKIIKQ